MFHFTKERDAGRIASVLAFALYMMYSGKSHGYFKVMVAPGNVGNLRLSLELGYQVISQSLVYDHKAHPPETSNKLAEVANYCSSIAKCILWFLAGLDQIHQVIPQLPCGFCKTLLLRNSFCGNAIKK